MNQMERRVSHEWINYKSKIGFSSIFCPFLIESRKKKGDITEVDLYKYLKAELIKKLNVNL